MALNLYLSSVSLIIVHALEHVAVLSIHTIILIIIINENHFDKLLKFYRMLVFE